MRRWALRFVFLTLVGSSWADTLPIQVDSPRNGAVYIREVDSGEDYRLLSPSTPAIHRAGPGERFDIKVVAPSGFFYRWVGERPNVAGPSYITVRLDRQLAWERVALVASGIFLSLLASFFRFRRRAKAEQEIARSQIVSLTQRAKSAEKVGALARTLGDYEVVDKLGAGAMGVVYKVRDQSGEVFAAKVPNEMDERVVREAEVSASLESPHIVRCFGLVKAEPDFLLFEYLQGQTVHDWLEVNHRPPLAEIDRLLGQLLRAVTVAHEAGVYHRDLKPENIFLSNDPSGTVLKVMDFGLASSVQAARLTRTGEAMGTPIYASPEQLSGNPVDATTDLYSVGVLIFELTTGKLPWSQTDPVALTLQKYKPLPREPVELRQDLPMEWNQLVVDLLSGDPSRRPQSVAELEMRWAEGRKHLF